MIAAPAHFATGPRDTRGGVGSGRRFVGAHRAFRLVGPSRRRRAFTLVELLVAMAVLVLLMALVAQLFNAASIVITSGNKHMDTDEQARAMLDRMAIDIGRIVQRADVDYFLKGRPASNSQAGGGAIGVNDQIAFYSEAPGYYPATATGVQTQSPVSLVAYRVNSTVPRLQRLGKGLVWNGVSSSAVPAGNTPLVFLPVPMASPLPSPLPSPMPNPVPSPAWPQAGDMGDDPDGDYEFIGPQVFRFEYYYVLKGRDDGAGGVLPSILGDTPWDTRVAGHDSVKGLRDVAAICVAVAVIDPKSRAIVSDTQLATLASQMEDFSTTMAPGDLEAQWRSALDGSTLPRAAVSAARIYARTFPLNSTP